jgi:hypothetical protein
MDSQTFDSFHVLLLIPNSSSFVHKIDNIFNEVHATGV